MAAIESFTDITVAVDNVYVDYRVPVIDGVPARGARSRRHPRNVLRRRPVTTVHALAGLSFVARTGETIGIVGQNGSGKSTLLRLIAGLERPTRGNVYATSIPVLIGMNAALKGELSGMQNARLGCLAMGMSPEETALTIPKIIELAALGEFIRLPMKTYSSGMAGRLRFAIATAANPRILLIDEALGAGDITAGDRYSQKTKELRENAGTIFHVSHAAQTIEETCSRAIWINKGRFIIDGPAGDIARRYRKWAWAIAKGRPAEAEVIMTQALSDGRRTTIDLVESTVLAGPPRHARARAPRIASP